MLWDGGAKAAKRDAAQRLARTSLATAQSAAQEARDELAKLGEQRGELPWRQRRGIANAHKQTAKQSPRYRQRDGRRAATTQAPHWSVRQAEATPRPRPSHRRRPGKNTRHPH